MIRELIEDASIQLEQQQEQDRMKKDSPCDLDDFDISSLPVGESAPPIFSLPELPLSNESIGDDDDLDFSAISTDNIMFDDDGILPPSLIPVDRNSLNDSLPTPIEIPDDPILSSSNDAIPLIPFDSAEDAESPIFKSMPVISSCGSFPPSSFDINPDSPPPIPSPSCLDMSLDSPPIPSPSCLDKSLDSPPIPSPPSFLTSSCSNLIPPSESLCNSSDSNPIPPPSFLTSSCSNSIPPSESLCNSSDSNPIPPPPPALSSQSVSQFPDDNSSDGLAPEPASDDDMNLNSIPSSSSFETESKEKKQTVLKNNTNCQSPNTDEPPIPALPNIPPLPPTPLEDNSPSEVKILSSSLNSVHISSAIPEENVISLEKHDSFKSINSDDIDSLPFSCQLQEDMTQEDFPRLSELPESSI